MSLFAFLGTLEIGLVYGLVALGVYLTFRILDFPDLTVDGSFPMGGAVAATAIVAGVNPWLATGLAMVAGAMCGLVTAFLAGLLGLRRLSNQGYVILGATGLGRALAAALHGAGEETVSDTNAANLSSKSAHCVPLSAS